MENSWGFSPERGVMGDWPADERGEPVAPVFLEHVDGNSIDLGMERRMLESFGIATICRYPNDGELGRVILGNAASGAYIFVPETQLEDARNILSSEPLVDAGPEETNEEEN